MTAFLPAILVRAVFKRVVGYDDVAGVHVAGLEEGHDSSAK
jgi:hypothetical protein